MTGQVGKRVAHFDLVAARDQLVDQLITNNKVYRSMVPQLIDLIKARIFR